MKRWALSIVAVVGIATIFWSALPSAQTIGVSLVRVFATRSTGLGIAIPTPYLRSYHTTAVGSYVVKSDTGVVGCVVIGVAGAASSTIALLNARGPVASPTYELLATIDATKVGNQFCYGMIFSYGLTVVVTSSGTVPDAVVTWR